MMKNGLLQKTENGLKHRATETLWVTERHGGDKLSDKQMSHRSLGLGTSWSNNSNKQHGRQNYIILRVDFTTQLPVK